MRDEIHPELDAHQQVITLLMLLFYFVIVLTAAIGLIVCGFFIYQGKVFNLAFVVIPLTSFAGAWGMHVFFKRWQNTEVEKLNYGTMLLNETEPRQLSLKFKKISSWRGPVVELQSRDGELFLVAALYTSNFNYPPAQASEVEVFYRADLPWLLYRWKGKLVFAYIYDITSLAQDRSRLKQVCCLISLIIILTLGFGVGSQLYKSQKTLNLARKSCIWPQTSGRVFRSGVQSWKRKHRNGDRADKFFAEIRYSYRVADHRFTGNRIWFGYRGSWSRGQAEKIAVCYPQSSDVMVFYDPEKPALAVLEPGHVEELEAREQGLWRSLISIPMVAVLICFLLFSGLAWRNDKRLKRLLIQMR